MGSCSFTSFISLSNWFLYLIYYYYCKIPLGIWEALQRMSYVLLSLSFFLFTISYKNLSPLAHNTPLIFLPKDRWTEVKRYEMRKEMEWWLLILLYVFFHLIFFQKKKLLSIPLLEKFLCQAQRLLNFAFFWQPYLIQKIYQNLETVQNIIIFLKLHLILFKVTGNLSKIL